MMTLVVAAALLMTMTLTPSTGQLILTSLMESGNETLESIRNQSRVNSKTIFYGPRFKHYHKKIESYSGYFTVNKEMGNHLFFWFFPAAHDRNTTPLALILEGGPGASSMINLLKAFGPIAINERACARDCPFTPRTTRLDRVFSTLFVDNPVGTGFSFSENGREGYVKTRQNYTDNLFSLLEQFFKLFPEFATKDLYIGGVGYAGKYAPSLAYKIHEEKTASNSTINLAGIFVGAPFFDPPAMDLTVADFAYNMGYYSFSEAEEHKRKVADFYGKTPEERAQYPGKKIFGLIAPRIDTRENRPMAFNFVTRPTRLLFRYLGKALNRKGVKEALHVSPNITFSAINHGVFETTLRHDLVTTVKDELGVIMDNYKVLLYNGDYDFLVNSLMVDESLKNTNWSRQQEFIDSKRGIWYESLDSRYYRTLRGYVTRVGNLCRVVVHGAGHHAAIDAPHAIKELLGHFVRGGCIGNKRLDSKTKNETTLLKKGKCDEDMHV